MNAFLQIVLAAIIVIALMLAVNGDQRPTAYDICWAAHNEVSGESEQACGEALDREGSVFMCNKSGDYCWTERV